MVTDRAALPGKPSVLSVSSVVNALLHPRESAFRRCLGLSLLQQQQILPARHALRVIAEDGKPRLEH